MFPLPKVHREAAKIAATYLIISFIWISASDKIMGMMIADPLVISYVSMAKGWFFVFVTAALLYVQIRRNISVIEKKEADLQNRHMESKHLTLMLECQINEMRSREEELKAKNRELDQFAYVISHDLKAPLRGIFSLSQWIEEDLGDKVSEEVKVNLDLLRNRVQRMQDMIQGLLEYSRAGRTAGQVGQCDVAGLLQEIVSDLNPPPCFRITWNEDMPVFVTDILRLRQVFTNLLDNAVKHHDKETGHINVSVQDMGHCYRFSVSDDGPGIAADYHDKIFELFRVLQSRDSKESTGVGLALVKKIVESQHGVITVKSGAECGTTICFTWTK